MRHQTTKDVYTFVWTYYEQHGFGPTQQEIAETCFLAQSSVSRHLDKLTIWGWISREEGKSRSVRPLRNEDKREQVGEKSDKKIR